MEIWGIDLGGTKIEGVILPHAGSTTPIARLRIPTESSKGYEHIISQLVSLIELLKKESGLAPTKIGIGTPGTYDPVTGLHKNSNTTCLNGKPFKQDVEKALKVPIFMANDANCFALAEATLGAVPVQCPQAEVVFGVIMGTGVGGGLVINGKVINGRHGIAGEWGQNFLDESGGESYSGFHGSVETIIAGPALEKYYEKISGTKLPLKEIYARHLAGTDASATATIQRLIQFFGKAIGVVINILDPDAIVLGGGVGNIDLLYTEGVAEAKKYTFNPTLDTKFLKPVLGDSAGVFGAAMLTV